MTRRRSDSRRTVETRGRRPPSVAEYHSAAIIVSFFFEPTVNHTTVESTCIASHVTVIAATVEPIAERLRRHDVWICSVALLSHFFNSSQPCAVLTADFAAPEVQNRAQFIEREVITMDSEKVQRHFPLELGVLFPTRCSYCP